MDKIKTTNTDMTHKEIQEQTKSELDRLVSEAKRKLDDLVKPELKVGKWYKFDTPLFEYLLKYDGSDTACGFADGTWSSSWSFSKDVNQELAKGKEATPQEVEEALVKEAKRRGIVEGVSVIDLDDGKDVLLQKGGGYILSSMSNKLFAHGATVFKDGKWAEVIEQPIDKFAELKEAYRNGAIIEYFNNITNKWTVIQGAPHWLNNVEYRIKPEEKPKVGDVFIAKIKSDKDIDRLLKFESYDRV